MISKEDEIMVGNEFVRGVGLPKDLSKSPKIVINDRFLKRNKNMMVQEVSSPTMGSEANLHSASQLET